MGRYIMGPHRQYPAIGCLRRGVTRIQRGHLAMAYRIIRSSPPRNNLVDIGRNRPRHGERIGAGAEHGEIGAVARHQIGKGGVIDEVVFA
jgi:hypothetical protein